LSLLLRRETVWPGSAARDQNRRLASERRPCLHATAPDRLDGGSQPERVPVYLRDMGSTRPLWKEGGQRVIGASASASPRLLQMIGAFERALRGTPPPAAMALQARIRAVRGKQDLWHLRADIYALVMQTYDRWEAQIRIDELDDLFDSSRPRAPFAP
jgi:hypothetical protein